MGKEYKGFDIKEFETGFTIMFEGDDIYFLSIEEAEAFIDKLEGTFYKVIGS